MRWFVPVFLNDGWQSMQDGIGWHIERDDPQRAAKLAWINNRGAQ